MQDVKVLQRKSNGVLPMPQSAQGQTNADSTAPPAKSGKSRAPPEGDKVVIRRLPPGLTEEEFWGYVGDQWKTGKGLVDWFDFKPGKISQDPAKTSKPGRACLHIKKQDNLLPEIAQIVETASWEDAKQTHLNPCLVGPPSLEFAIYKRTPGLKKRNDQRQGTIDQDPEFMAFLHSLTNPEPDKDASANEDKTAFEDTEPEVVKVTTTPLIEYLKEKKANKAKEAAAAKSAKHARQESQGGKGGKSNAATGEEPKRSKKEKEAAKNSKSSDKPKETVKILTKKAATAEAAKAAENAASQVNAAQEAPKSRRANIAAAARILQRDLGLSPGSAHRRARLNAAKSEAEAKEAAAASDTLDTASETAPATKNDSTTPVSPIAQTTVTKEQAERPSTPSNQKSGRSRRGGGKNSKEGKESKDMNNDAKVKTADPTPNAAKPTSNNPPVVLLKKKDRTASPAPAAPKTATTVDTADTAAAAPPAAPAPTKSTNNNGKASSNAGKGSNKKSSAASVTPGVTRAFVKHANPSQGVTEAILKQTLSEKFGAVSFVEVDRRKGFAYVDFTEHQSLVKAVSASPVSVAQASVQVLERKEKKGGANANANATTSATASPANSTDKTEAKAVKPEKAEGQAGARRNRRGRGGGGGQKGPKNEGAKEAKQDVNPKDSVPAG